MSILSISPISARHVVRREDIVQANEIVNRWVKLQLAFWRKQEINTQRIRGMACNCKKTKRKNQKNRKKRQKLRKIVEGASGLVRSAFPSRVSPEEIDRRRGICEGCDKKKIVAGCLKCGECGCLIMAKSRLPEEKCPLDKW